MSDVCKSYITILSIHNEHANMILYSQENHILCYIFTILQLEKPIN